MKGKKILLTGQPGCGKTTLVQRLAHSLRGYHPAGFYTAEVRVRGIRQGFEMVSLTGEKREILAHTGLKSRYIIGRYGVDIPAFEHFLSTLPLGDPSHRLLIIDEIGRMECLSHVFQERIITILLGDVPLIATIAIRGDGFIEGVRNHWDTVTLQVTYENRDSVFSTILGMIHHGEPGN